MISVHGITFDCANVSAVAQFWYETLGGRIGPGAPEDTAVLEARADAGPLTLAFRKVPEGKFFKNRVHLDLVADDFDLEGDLVASAAAEPGLAARTWVLLTEAPDGGWGLQGHANTNAELVTAARDQIAQLQS